MDIPNEAIPPVRPMPPYRIGDITPAQFTQSPEQMGLQEASSGGSGPILAQIQERHMRVFYARYFSVSPEQLSVAIGIDQGLLTTAQQVRDYEQVKDRLEKQWEAMRSKTFGPNSFFDKFVEHTVLERNFRIVLYNMQRTQAMLGIAERNEDAAARTAREAERTALGLAVADHIDRYNASRIASIAAAQNDLNNSLLELHKPRNRAEELRFQDKLTMKRRTLAFRIQHDTAWPTLPDFSEFEERRVFPPPKILYKNMRPRTTIRFWKELWSLDIGATMLWQVRNTVDIPATLANAEDIYMNAFAILCIELWHHCLSVPFDNARATQRLQDAGYNVVADVPCGAHERDLVYKYFGKSSKKYLPDAEGISALRLLTPGISSTYEADKKRKFGLDLDTTDRSGLRIIRPRV